ncbi:uncharacterized protein L969DRAFT_96794 [Mixia osmundae IAM 14324]|uniref:PNPLA domain-containing protein n=1 Tax=Mixia osmundae (strain CBS 9802 / IAM 14324 / JCM 22182 / KY 12970) TaxID=764103 RepID=G7E242_MIXOS|nr:uncharacterized protein L969DRAFT_96794 [Mixia osmundae IAM 14324]KEI36772.1 hypothetical protein L969DRAFT_96794 [Mixia osmundae IAM 14324]GAA96902.1 hypothetical protein E5Q_03575 [Mixia osmundae IAM 14324]
MIDEDDQLVKFLHECLALPPVPAHPDKILIYNNALHGMVSEAKEAGTGLQVSGYRENMSSSMKMLMPYVTRAIYMTTSLSDSSDQMVRISDQLAVSVALANGYSILANFALTLSRSDEYVNGDKLQRIRLKAKSKASQAAKLLRTEPRGEQPMDDSPSLKDPRTTRHAQDNLEPAGEGQRPAEFDVDYIDREAMEAFARALSDDEGELITSVSDFAPIRQRIKRATIKSSDVVREGWAYHLARWPLLLIIFVIIGLEFFLYVIVRQAVNVTEYFGAWRGFRGELRRRLRSAKSYDEWKEHALELDKHLRYGPWKANPHSAYYDSSLVRRVKENLQHLREHDDAEGVRAVLEVCLRSNFAGLEGFRLYSETFYGTKDLIEAYLDEVATCIRYVSHTDAIDGEEKTRFFKTISRNYGRSALCLSGGATFGYYHFGVVRALLDANLLPQVITGTSAGALVAAFLCTRTDEELRLVLIPELAEKITACEEGVRIWVPRAIKTGARFNTVQWAEKACWMTRGATTFKEAYERTGRILNVSVVPMDQNSPTKLLNFHTAPDCVIFSAIIASAAVPGILNPVTLLTKSKDGKIKPWQFQGRHKDGSLRVDIPIDALHKYFNVVHPIVSQSNPHIHLFNFAPRGSPGRPVSHRKGKGWRGGFFLSAAERLLKIELTKNFKVLRDLELLPELMGQNWSAVFLQRFEGSITIWPKSRAWDWVRILTDPDEAELARMIDVGQRVTWPKIHMIENRLKIETEIDAGRQQVRKTLALPISGKSHLVALSPAPGDASALDTSALDSSSDDGALQSYFDRQKLAPGVANETRHIEHNRAASVSSQIRKRQIMKQLGLSRSAQGKQHMVKGRHQRPLGGGGSSSDSESDRNFAVDRANGYDS